MSNWTSITPGERRAEALKVLAKAKEIENQKKLKK